MSNIHNDAILERLFDEAWAELCDKHPDLDEDTIYGMACDLAQKRWEFDYDEYTQTCGSYMV